MSNGIRSWNAGVIVGKSAEQVQRGMNRALAFCEGYAKDLVSVPNSDGSNPSKPGEPPHRVTGILRANISFEPAVIEGTVVRGRLGVLKGPASDYAHRLEEGFVGEDSLGRNIDQAPRPYLRPSILRNREKIVELVSKG